MPFGWVGFRDRISAGAPRKLYAGFDMDFRLGRFAPFYAGMKFLSDLDCFCMEMIRSSVIHLERYRVVGVLDPSGGVSKSECEPRASDKFF